MNTHATIELFDVAFFMCPRSIKYSICCEKKVGDQFFPELFVSILDVMTRLWVCKADLLAVKYCYV
jgi:hypothetical protein